MSIDRNGMAIRLGYWEHEILWIQAANDLRGLEREQAYVDIAAMTCRTVRAIQCKATKLRSDKRDNSRKVLGAAMGRNWVPEPQETSRRLFVATPTREDRKHHMPPSAFPKPSKAALMSGKAPTRKPREILAAE